MRTLIVKLNATGDVVRTTTLLRRLEGPITWLTASNNVELFTGATDVRCLPWEDRESLAATPYDLVISLEDEREVAAFVSSLPAGRIHGAYLDRATDAVRYSDDASAWFDLSLISTHGRRQADALKLKNRRTYQDLVFSGIGWEFGGEAYVLPPPIPTGLSGDVALAPVAGPVWPMKAWAYYEQLKAELEAAGHVVNVLPRRPSLREHLGDIAGHRCLVSGDSLPMHLALGLGIPCVTIFNCTSPWEIYDYGLQTKMVSPHLEEFFYRRGFDPRATQAISLAEVYEATVRHLMRSGSLRERVAVSQAIAHPVGVR